MKKQFHIGDILTITTGKMVSLRNIKGLCDILNFMTKDKLDYCQLPRAGDECKIYLLKQHPQLKDMDVSKVTGKNWKKWLNKQIVRFGETLSVCPIPKGVHQIRHPFFDVVDIIKSKR